MDEKMNKEQVIEATIRVLSDISVPVRLKDQITTPIEGAINNLAIALQMIRAENEMNRDLAEKQENEEPEQDPEPAEEPADPKNLFELTPEDVGCPEDDPEPGMEPLVMPEKEAGEDEPEADPE